MDPFVLYLKSNEFKNSSLVLCEKILTGGYTGYRPMPPLHIRAGDDSKRRHNLITDILYEVVEELRKLIVSILPNGHSLKDKKISKHHVEKVFDTHLMPLIHKITGKKKEEKEIEDEIEDELDDIREKEEELMDLEEDVEDIEDGLPDDLQN
jgi:Ran GTPase-activating protein (RanGAP) involved in mRNA processing and transport